MTAAADAVLAGLPEHKQALARLLLAARAPVPDQPGPRGDTGPVPATPTQERLWRHAATGDRAAGTGSHAIRLRGPLDPDTLREALTAVTRRHEALRTSFAEGPDGLTQVIAAEPELRLRSVDLSGATYTAQATEVARHVVASAGQSLDLAAGQGSAYRLLRLGPQDHVLVLAAHLAIFDGWSSGVLLNDLSDAYQGRAPQEPPLQLADFAAWQRRWLAAPAGVAESEHWQEALAGLPPAPTASGFTRGHVTVGLDPDVTAAGFALGTAEGATPFMTLLAALAAVAARRDGRTDVVIGTPASGRLFDAVQGAIGQFTTVVPIRVDCSGRPSFPVLLRRVRAAVAGALPHQRLPVDTLCGGAAPPWSVLFALHNYPAVPLDLPGVEVSQMPGPPARHLELYSPVPAATEACVGLVERDGRISGVAEFNREAVTSAQVTGLIDGVATVLSAAAADPRSAVLT